MELYRASNLVGMVTTNGLQPLKRKRVRVKQTKLFLHAVPHIGTTVRIIPTTECGYVAKYFQLY